MRNYETPSMRIVSMTANERIGACPGEPIVQSPRFAAPRSLPINSNSVECVVTFPGDS